MLNDLRYAARTLLRNPGFTITAVFVLAAGIGATTAMFGAVNGVLLRPLPYPDPARLFVVRETRAQQGFERTVLSEGEFLAWIRNSPVLQDATIVAYPGLALRSDGEPERIGGLRVSADFFPLFGITPVAGRAFGRDAEQPGRDSVLLISHDLWQRRFGGGDVVGRGVMLEGRPATIIGVLPRGLSLNGRFDAIVPMTLGPEQAAQFSAHSFDVFARLPPAVTREQAIAALSAAALAGQRRPAHANGATLVPLREEVVGQSETALLVLFGAVALVLLIACANISNLLLARAAVRQKEMAVRTALGASAWRVVRQLVTESVLLSVIGGGFGVLLALWLTDLLARAAADSVPRAAEIGFDARAFGFAAGVSVLTGVLFGVAPAWQASRADVNSALKQETRGGVAAGRQRALSAFVVVEIALALVLLIGAGLLLASFQHLRAVRPGFDAARVLTAPGYLPRATYTTPEEHRAFFRRATAELAAIPGVTAAAATDALPLSGDNSSGSFSIEGAAPADAAHRPNADRRAITPDYFAVMGTPVLEGRAFTDADGERSAGVVIVSRRFADTFLGGTDPVGTRLKLARLEAKSPWLTIVGVVGNVRHASLAQNERPVIYYPHAQNPDRAMVFVIRSAGAPSSIAGAVRTTLQRIDPDLPVNELRPMTDIVRLSMFDRELELLLLGSFAVFALVLSAAGIYGVMAFAVAQRTPEFGVRVALGATRTDIMRLVGRQGLRLTAAGLALGVPGAWFASSLLSALLVEVQPTNAAVFAATTALLATVSILACLIPARRALRVDPLTALRAQ